MEIKESIKGSWHAYDYKFDSESWADNPGERSPYIILGEYGSGFDLEEDGYYTHYNDSSPTFGAYRGQWNVKSTDRLEFIHKDPDKEVFEITIVKFEEDELWIDEVGYVQYKLKRIQ